ncbi:MAG: type II toxin-antitoxin system HicA family toxin [Chloroflexia bacterium]|nr:type II toxin-antitoxin system HicA family toxin [Chloroflexia bacterium]
MLRDGWYQRKSTGGHQQFRHKTKPGIVTIPFHGGGGTPDPATVQSIL